MVFGKTDRLILVFLLVFGIIFCLNVSLSAQFRLQVSIIEGFGISSCTNDVSKHRWQVNIDETGWETYPFLPNCFKEIPHQQLDRTYPCAAVLPDSIQIAYRTFKNDGLLSSCQVIPDCAEGFSTKFRVPLPGDSATYTIEISNQKPSWGYVRFTIRVLPGENISNDLRCNALALGALSAALGDSSAYVYDNFCAGNAQEPNTLVNGAFPIEAGSWFSFQTPAEPISLVQLLLKSDTTDAIGLEAALFGSQGNDCRAAIQLQGTGTDRGNKKALLNLSCLEPNQTYYLLVDGDGQQRGLLRGKFSLYFQAIESQEAPDQICDAQSLNPFPDATQVTSTKWQSNFCATTSNDPIPPQQTITHPVWYRFTAPRSGRVLVKAWTDSLAFGFSPRLAVYSTADNCTGNGIFLTGKQTFSPYSSTLEHACLDVGKEYFLLVDGLNSQDRGRFKLKLDTLQTIRNIQTRLDTTICAGASLRFDNRDLDSTGVYFASYTARDGCDSTVQLQLKVSVFTLYIQPDQVQLASGPGKSDAAINVSVRGGSGQYRYLWCTGQTDSVGTGLTGGELCCLVVEDLYCQSKKDTCLTIQSAPPLQLKARTQPANCRGQANGQIVVHVDSGLPSFKYTWTKEDNTLQGSGALAMLGDSLVLNRLSAGIYLINIQDQYNDSLLRVQVSEPIANEYQVLRSKGLTCMGACDAETMLLITTGVPREIRWSNGSRGTPARGFCAGDNGVIITDERGCVDSLSFFIPDSPPLSVAITIVKEVSCVGASDGTLKVSTSTSLQSVIWNTGASGAMLNGLAPGNYLATVIDSNGCRAQVSQTLNSPTPLLAPTFRIVQPITCAEGSDGSIVALSDHSNLTYFWSTGSNSAIVKNLSAGTYQVTIANAQGCVASAAVDIVAPPPLELILETEDATCANVRQGGTVEVALARGGYSVYQFSVDDRPFFAQERVEGIAPGPHTFVLRDRLGCELRQDFSIVGPPEFLVELGPDRSIQFGDSIRIQTTLNNPALRYTWRASPAIIEPLNRSSEQYLQPTQNTRIELTVIDTLTGCSSTDVINVLVDQSFKVYAPNAFSPNGDQHNDYFLLYTANQTSQIRMFRIFDRYGNLLFERQNIPPNDESVAWDGSFRGKAMNLGTYVYFAEVVRSDGKTQIVKGTVNLLR